MTDACTPAQSGEGDSDDRSLHGIDAEWPQGSIALEESALPYTVHVLNLSQLQQKEPDYLKINPNGRIPAIVDRDEGDFAVFSRAPSLCTWRKDRTPDAC